MPFVSPCENGFWIYAGDAPPAYNQTELPAARDRQRAAIPLALGEAFDRFLASGSGVGRPCAGGGLFFPAWIPPGMQPRPTTPTSDFRPSTIGFSVIAAGPVPRYFHRIFCL